MKYLLADHAAALIDRIIMDQIPEGSRVLDLGCGDGRLLCRLRDEMGASIQGVERDPKAVIAAISKGVPVIQADLDQGLDEIPDHAFDYAVLSQTLQQVIQPENVVNEMLRAAQRAIVVVPNFGHWRIRLQILVNGRVPITSELPYDWYNTPNLHFLTMIDFRALTERLQLRIVRELPIVSGVAKAGLKLANLRAESALFVLERMTNEVIPITIPEPQKPATEIESDSAV
ncbi:methionine biosynthesis protein MetW [Planctopirus hydrillae]|uniref:Methionine biosynthesis protein MetW n=1 Tax=Planctopirus hydrillae TaxID=1841610 RepID=A0A1C3E720_9PLAN|nr:methionine biosynthesis protein MetW [Planctopirus hydrillae]ODA29042.1 methionine biosynthesis protein MetW [Planctopirus hydrillae]